MVVQREFLRVSDEGLCVAAGREKTLGMPHQRPHIWDEDNLSGRGLFGHNGLRDGVERRFSGGRKVLADTSCG